MSMLETIQKSVETHSIVRHKKQTIDAFSASAILAVYNALSAEAKAKYATIIETNILKAASIAFKLCK